MLERYFRIITHDRTQPHPAKKECKYDQWQPNFLPDFESSFSVPKNAKQSHWRKKQSVKAKSDWKGKTQ
jgi:hypothetical protein